MPGGHGLSLLARADGTVTQLPGDGLPIGVVPGDAWTPRTVVLAPGDTVAVVSDGALDLFSERAGTALLGDFLGQHTDPEDLCTALTALRDGQIPHDDITVMAIRRG